MRPGLMPCRHRWAAAWAGLLGLSSWSWLANSVKSPLQVRLNPPTPPMCGILDRRSHFESRFTRRSWSLVPSYLTLVTVFHRVAIRADTGSRAVGIIRDWASENGPQAALR